MTDEELVRAVAEKIMGYKITGQHGTVVEFQCGEYGMEFDPLTHRANFGSAWIKLMDLPEGRRALMRWMLEMINGDDGK